MKKAKGLPCVDSLYRLSSIFSEYNHQRENSKPGYETVNEYRVWYKQSKLMLSLQMQIKFHINYSNSNKHLSYFIK